MNKISKLVEEWGINENTIVLEPQEDFNEGLIGVSEDKQHLIYSYQKLTESLAKSYQKDNKDSEETYEDFLNQACEWVDYNTIRSLPYMDADFVPIIIYEF